MVVNEVNSGFVQGEHLQLPNRQHNVQAEQNSTGPNAQYEDIVDTNNQLTIQNAERNEDTEMSREQIDDPYEDVENISINIGSEYQDLGERPVQVPVIYDRVMGDV